MTFTRWLEDDDEDKQGGVVACTACGRRGKKCTSCSAMCWPKVDFNTKFNDRIFVRDISQDVQSGLATRALKLRLREYKKTTSFLFRPIVRTKFTCGTCRKEDVIYCEGCGLTIFEKMYPDFQFLNNHANPFSALVSMLDEWMDKLDEDAVNIPKDLFEELTDFIIPIEYRRNGL